MQKDIPRSPRNTNDGRLFTQPYAPRRDQGEYNNNSNNNSYRNTGYVRPSQSPNQPYHHHHHYSPQQIHHSPQQQQHNLPPSPMSHRASPNFTPNKKSPHMPQSSPQNIQMTASWSPAGQYVSFHTIYLAFNYLYSISIILLNILSVFQVTLYNPSLDHLLSSHLLLEKSFPL